MRIGRRELLSGAALGLAGAVLPRALWAETAFSVGGMEVTTLSDGYLIQPADFMFAPMDQAVLGDFLTARGMDRTAPLTPPCTLTLVRHEGRVILFDAGSGTGFMDTVGTLPDALAALGLAPEDVTDVVFTHGHADHLWGATDDFDEAFFANATHHMGRIEFDYWADPATIDSISADRVPMAAGAKRRLDLIGERFSFFEDGAELLPGVHARATFGHSPGHMGFVLADGTDTAMVVGDALLNDHTAFAHPDWPLGADSDRDQAAATRATLLDQLATERMMMIGFHLPSGGVGHVARDGDGYRFEPA